MKFSNFLGSFGALLVFVGGLFKVMHWPGASIILLLGALFTLIYLFFWLPGALQRASSSKEKTAQIMVFGTCVLTLIGALFRIQHWPFAGPLFMINMIVLILGFIPFYLIYLVSETDENRRASRQGFFVLYLVLSGVLNLVGKSSTTIYQLSMAEEFEAKQGVTMASNNAALFTSVSQDSAHSASATHIKEISDKLIKHIDQLKIAVMQASDEKLKDKPDVKLSDVPNIDNYDLPTIILLGSDPGNLKTGANTASELKDLINGYKEELKKTLGGEVKYNLGLSTEDRNDADGTKVNWELATFYHTPIVGAMIIFDQLQNEIHYAELMAYAQLMSKH